MLNLKKIFLLLLGILFFCACDEEMESEKQSASIPKRTMKDYIRKIPGKNEPIPAEVAQKGEVLVAYSDCYTCHTKEKRSKGPAFKDIAQRYPVQKTYIDMLAHRVIAGGSGSWGSPIMSPHPQLSHEEAKAMVTYILSLNMEAN